ncbi:MAG: hypothetical protein AB7L18_13075, partial [Hyphomicrobiaceae bacterium]
PAQLAAGAAPSLQIVLDASGSMWGALVGESVAKHIAVRRELQRVLPPVASTRRTGLVAFGPGCRAADQMTPLGDYDAVRLLAPLDRFNPRGRGPLVAGIEGAAATMPPAAPGDIVLFHDGLDNCGGDICAAAERLASTHPMLKVHVVSLGVAPAEQEAISCLARRTKGAQFAVTDAASLAAALDKLRGMLSQGRTAAPATAAATADRSPAPARETERTAPSGPPQLVAEAVLAAGKAKVTVPVRWRVFDAADDRLLADTASPTLQVKSPPRRVRIVANVGNIEARGIADVAASGTTRVQLPLGAGIVRLDTGAQQLASEADEPLMRIERIEVVSASGAAEGGAASSQPLWIARGKAIEAILPAGRYRAVAEYGLARAEARIDVAEGSEQATPLTLSAGRLELTATGVPSASGIVFAVETDDPSAGDGRRLVARSAHTSPAFVLPTGAYYVTAHVGEESIRRTVAVRSGQATREVFAVSSGRLTLRPTRDGSAFDDPAAIAIVTREGDTASARRVVTGIAIELPVGRYVATLMLGGNAPSVRRPFEIQAGRALSLDLPLPSSGISLTAPEGANIARCDVVDRNGAIILRSVAANASARVEPGDYVVRCLSAEAERRQAVKVEAGQRLSVGPRAP